MFLRRILTSGAGSALLAKFKESTGIVGLEVVPNAREVLISLYTKTLQEIKGVPENEVYRKAVECFTSHRLKVCQEEEEDWEQIEKRIGCGQVEELIEEAQDELKLIDKMIGHAIGDKQHEEAIFTHLNRILHLLDMTRSSARRMKVCEWNGTRGVFLMIMNEVIEDDSPIPKHVPHHRSPPLPEEFHRTPEAITSKPAPKDEASTETKA